MNWKNGMLFVLSAALFSATLLLNSRDTAQGQGGIDPARPRFVVVETRDREILVTDNTRNFLYFYSNDRDDYLRLRATVDLAQVGSDTITIEKPKARLLR